MSWSNTVLIYCMSTRCIIKQEAHWPQPLPEEDFQIYSNKIYNVAIVLSHLGSKFLLQIAVPYEVTMQGHFTIVLHLALTYYVTMSGLSSYWNEAFNTNSNYNNYHFMYRFDSYGSKELQKCYN